MINIKPTILKALKTVTRNVNDCYPSDWATFPVIQYMEEDNKTHTKTDNIEQLAYLRYKIDIWNKRGASDAALAVDGVLSSLGLKRIFCSDVPDPSGLKHKVMRYEGIIDKDMKYVFN
jgi:hypothetical protein